MRDCHNFYVTDFADKRGDEIVDQLIRYLEQVKKFNTADTGVFYRFDQCKNAVLIKFCTFDDDEFNLLNVRIFKDPVSRVISAKKKYIFDFIYSLVRDSIERHNSFKKPEIEKL